MLLALHGEGDMLLALHVTYVLDYLPGPHREL
jgi:hypothetical protein